MGLSEKEKSRRYRERLKADPDKLAERKRKKRESYHKNKKLVANMEPEEKNNCRITNNVPWTTKYVFWTTKMSPYENHIIFHSFSFIENQFILI